MVSDEINSLTKADWDSLRRYAHSRMQRLGGTIAGKDGDDLLQEALMAFLRGGRRRVKGQAMVEHLFGIMHSIAGDWPRKLKNTSEVTYGLLNRNSEVDEEDL